MKKRKFGKFIAIACLGLAFTTVSLTGLVSCDNEPQTEESGGETATLSSIRIDSSACKTTFEYGEEFTYDGLKVFAVMSDKTEKQVNLSDCRINEPNMTTPGKKNVVVVYQGKTARYEVTIKERVMAEIDTNSIVSLTTNEDKAFRVEAEAINLAPSKITLPDGETETSVTVPETDEVTSGGKYLSNYGVVGNNFGFTFTSDAEYTDVTIAINMAWGGFNSLDLGSNLDIYLNYENHENTNSIGLEGRTILAGSRVEIDEETEEEVEIINETQWKEVVFRDITIKKGTNTLRFDVLGEEVPNIDYIDFYVGRMYKSTVVEIEEVGQKIVDLEDFDTEKATTRKDFADAHGVKPGEVFLESTSNPEETSKGTSIAAIVAPSEFSTTISNAENITLNLKFRLASVEHLIADDMYEFYIDGVRLEQVERVDIKKGNPAASEYWEWYETDFGTYNIPAGDHLFSVKLVGGNGGNIDCMIFNTLSYGSYDPSGVDLYNQPIQNEEITPQDPKAFTIDKKADYLIQAENLDLSQLTLRSDQTSLTENWNNDFGSGACVKGFAVGGVLTYKFTLSDKATVNLGMRMSHYDSEDYDFVKNTEITLNETSLTATAKDKFGHREGQDYWKWVEVDLGTHDLEAGEYIFTIKWKEDTDYGNASSVNIDRFTAKVSAYGEFSK